VTSGIGRQLNVKAVALANNELSSRISPTMSRRLFTQRTVSAAAISVFSVSPIKAEEKLSVDFAHKPDGLSVADWDEVQARYRNLLRVYGERLSATERKSIVRILTTNQFMLASIRSFVVQNSDPSSCTLRLVT